MLVRYFLAGPVSVFDFIKTAKPGGQTNNRNTLGLFQPCQLTLLKGQHLLQKKGKQGSSPGKGKGKGKQGSSPALACLQSPVYQIVRSPLLPPPSAATLWKTTIWGPTCDSADCVYKVGFLGFFGLKRVRANP
jgi:hypothetical protein